LLALYDGVPKPWQSVDPTSTETNEWSRIVAALRKRRLLASSAHTLTKAGRRFVDDLLFRHRGSLPALSPDGALQPFRLHVAPIGSGARVIEDEQIWTFVSQTMRKTLGIEMEAAALGELVHRHRHHELDWVVMKGVMDFADHGRDDHFKEFAARASAECLLWFLREHVPSEPTAGFDDLLTSGTLRLPDRVPAPSMLLNARYAVVPWHEAGRSEVLADLDAWADEPSRTVTMRLLHAEGGVGKTRLAIEWVRRRREQHNAAGFLVSAPDSRWLERLCGLGPPVIVVVDYAERRGDLEAVLRRVADFGATAESGRRVRVLLLARSDGDWWKALLQRFPEIAALRDDHEPLKLLPLATTPAEREAVFAEASRAFATYRGMPPTSALPKAIEDDRSQRVLYLHMAALAAVEGTSAESIRGSMPSARQRVVDQNSLMDEILAHEERFWTREESRRSGAALDVRLARQLVAAATLRGELSTWDDACSTCERLMRRSRGRQDEAIIELLHDIYDCGAPGRYQPGLEPDLLGEGMVLRVAAPPPGTGDPVDDAWIERVIMTGDETHATTAAFTVLGCASATNPEAIRPWIARLLRSEISTRARLALRAAKAVGQRTASSALGDALAEALERDGSFSIARELAEEEIPHPTISLRRVAAWLSRTELEYAPTGDNEQSLATRAARLLERGTRLTDLGEREPALAATEEAVDLHRRLVVINPSAFQSRLAGSLNNLGIRLSDLGRHEGALEATSEATRLFRTLAGRNPDLFQPELARTLSNLGLDLSALGRREPAHAATSEAVRLYRALAERKPDEFQPDLALSLNNLGITLSALGQRDAALAATREAARLFRTLAARNPDAFQADLALTLTNLGTRLSALGQRELALEATHEAVCLYRALVERNPDAFQPDLASTLCNLGNRLSALGKYESALDATREAAGLRRTLAARNPNRFQSHLAGTLNNLGLRLSELGQHELALATTHEAVELYRTLAARNPDAFESDVAMSLSNLGNTLSVLGQREAALAATCEAVDLYRSLAVSSPDAFQPDLARTLNNLGDRLSELGQRSPALAATREAVDIYRSVAAGNPDVPQADLATALENLADRLRDLDETRAFAAAEEAAAIRRRLEESARA
jgi:tetratricopeptide (TPR) repeat protein